MSQQKVIVVNVGGKIPDHFSEMELPKVNELLNNGFSIKEIHQIATAPSAGASLVVGVVILTFVLVKD